MKKICLILLLSTVSLSVLQAQSLKGTVYELNSSEPIGQVDVTNLTTKEEVQSSQMGEFTIAVKLDDLLTFAYPGFRTDTLVVTNLDFKRVYLTPIANFNLLEDVEISTLSDAQLDEQIAIADRQGGAVNTVFGGGVAISPSRIFGKKGKEARQRYQYLMAEKTDRAIMRRFSPELITSITPLEGEDLTRFIAKYKPSYGFIMKADDEQLRLYIMDSFKAFNQLSDEEKRKIALPTTGS